jgi:hypothetical protein
VAEKEETNPIKGNLRIPNMKIKKPVVRQSKGKIKSRNRNRENQREN